MITVYHGHYEICAIGGVPLFFPYEHAAIICMKEQSPSRPGTFHSLHKEVFMPGASAPNVLILWDSTKLSSALNAICPEVSVFLWLFYS